MFHCLDNGGVLLYPLYQITPLSSSAVGAVGRCRVRFLVGAQEGRYVGRRERREGEEGEEEGIHRQGKSYNNLINQTVLCCLFCNSWLLGTFVCPVTSCS